MADWDISLARYFYSLIEILSAIWKARGMEESQEKDCSFLFPNLYVALVYERKFKSEYLERQIYERSLKGEPFIVKLIENKSDLSKLTLYHLKKRATRRPRRAREPSRIPLLFLRAVSIKHGLRTADCGLWTADRGPRTTDCGPRTADWV